VAKSLPSQEDLRDAFSYDSQTGRLIWVKCSTSKIKPGTPAGKLNKTGYIQIKFRGCVYYAHRLIWMYHTGEDPGKLFVDHINLDRSDNRIENLRLVTVQQNAHNTRVRSHSKSGFKGVYFERGRYRVRIRVDGRTKNFGSYPTPEEAYSVYLQTVSDLNGSFAFT
jgi:HNH endonuclease